MHPVARGEAGGEAGGGLLEEELLEEELLEEELYGGGLPGL